MGGMGSATPARPRIMNDIALLESVCPRHAEIACNVGFEWNKGSGRMEPTCGCVGTEVSFARVSMGVQPEHSDVAGRGCRPADECEREIERAEV
jgi:hypothetical protein